MFNSTFGIAERLFDRVVSQLGTIVVEDNNPIKVFGERSVLWFTRLRLSSLIFSLHLLLNAKRNAMLNVYFKMICL